MDWLSEPTHSASAELQESGRIEISVPEVRLGRDGYADRGGRVGDTFELGRRGMRGVNETPVPIEESNTMKSKNRNITI